MKPSPANLRSLCCLLFKNSAPVSMLEFEQEATEKTECATLALFKKTNFATMAPFPANLRSLRCLLFKNSTLPVRAAFTLTELLVVITIIAILLGLLYGAIRTVSRFSRETITRGELANIEAAWKQYYNYYHTWPPNAVESANNTVWPGKDAKGDITYEIGPKLANMLAGVTNDTATAGLNPDGVSFLELTRFDSVGAPISAWGVSRGQRYYVKLDFNGDNQLMVPIDATASCNTTNLFRRVAVWTANPDIPGKLIGSWMQ